MNVTLNKFLSLFLTKIDAPSFLEDEVRLQLRLDPHWQVIIKANGFLDQYISMGVKYYELDENKWYGAYCRISWLIWGDLTEWDKRVLIGMLMQDVEVLTDGVEPPEREYIFETEWDDKRKKLKAYRITRPDSTEVQIEEVPVSP